MLWRFQHRRRGCTSTARGQRNGRCRCYGFRGCAVYIAVFPLARYAGREAGAAAVVPAIPPVRNLKNCLLLTMHGLLLVSTFILLFHFLYRNAQSGFVGIFFRGRARKGSGNRINFPPSGRSCGRAYTPMLYSCVCLLIWLKKVSNILSEES